MEKEILFKQIILVTDGESNGEKNPIDVAKKISEKGITISTIGIIDRNNTENSIYEVKEIAQVGNGVWELTELNRLSHTMQLVTQKSIYQTIQTAVNKELKNLISTDINELAPQSREKILDLVEDLSDTITLKSIILLDTSKSMTSKIDIAKKSILSLLNILNSREGKSKIAVVAFPHIERENYNLICDFTQDIHLLRQSLDKVQVSGMTPTAEALEGALKILEGNETEEYLEKCLVL